MYYAEKLIDGVWHYKTLPSQDWKPMTESMLNESLTDLKEQLYRLKRKMGNEK